MSSEIPGMPVSRVVLRVSLCLALAFPALALHPSRTSAQVASAQLAHARQMLSEYDPAGERTVQALAELHVAARMGSPRDPSVREARFLRAALATDLLLVGALDASRAVSAPRIATAIGVPADGLVDHLRAELRAVRVGHFTQPVDEALAALAAAETGDPSHLGAGSPVRRDVLFALTAAEALELADDPVQALAPLADDPCAESCDPSYAWLDVHTRRAVYALELAERALGRLAGIEHEDPFVGAVGPAIAAAEARLAAVQLSPTPVLPESLAHAGNDQGTPLHPDVVLALSSDAVHVAWVPVLRVADHRITSVAAGPDLSTPQSVALPSSYRPIVQSIDEISQIAATLGPSHVVAVTVTDAPAHLVVRTLVSLARAGIERVYIGRRDSEGHLRAIAVQVTEPTEMESLRGNLHVRVRLGGFAVSRGEGREVSIDRTRDDAGLHYDYDSLSRVATSLSHRTVSIEAMHSVEGRDFLDVAFRVAGPEGIRFVRR